MRSIFRMLVLVLCISAFTMSCLTAATIAEKSKAELSIHDFDVGMNLESVVVNDLYDIEEFTVDYTLQVLNIGYTAENSKFISSEFYVNIMMRKIPSTNKVKHYNYAEPVNYNNMYKKARDLPI